MIPPEQNHQEFLRNLFGDKSKYVQIFVNFLHHAIKMAPAKSQIRLNIGDFEAYPVYFADDSRGSISFSSQNEWGK